MTLRPIDTWYHEREEPAKSCLQYLRQHIAAFDPGITEAWKYHMPFFCYHGKMICYLWQQKKTGWPYLGLVDGNKMNIPGLVSEKRARMKIWLVDPMEEIPLDQLDLILTSALALAQAKHARPGRKK